MTDDPSMEGSIATFLRHENPNWPTNRAVYHFPEITSGAVTFHATKNYDRTVTIFIVGPFGNSYDFKVPIPPCDEKGLHVTITWGKDGVILYLNGKRVKARKPPRTVH